MSMAEERALEQYPKRFKMYGSFYGNGRELKIDVNAQYRNVYIEGYQQAEKDLELTVDDIKDIDKLLNQCVDYSNPYQEVLKRFKNLKEK